MTEEPSTRTSRRTILFVDVASSSELYEHLGDRAAHRRVRPCLEEIALVARRHGGEVVKSLGDGLLVAFGAEAGAVEAAFGMVASAPSHRLRVRVGLHAGEVLESRGDLFGQAVNTAARIAALARPSEVLVSSDVYGRLREDLQFEARKVPALSVKGVSEPLQLYALAQRDGSATLTLTATSIQPLLRSGAGGLELELGGRTWSVGPLARFTLGRGPENDLVLDLQQVSRRHASIHKRRGKFVLADQSVNGTWLVPDDGSRLHLVREEAPLHGSGRLHLGLDPERGRDHAIVYRVRG